jgi:hypothetical protein
MTVIPLFVQVAIGVMNIRRIMKLGCAIDVMLFIVRNVMKWTNVKTVEKLSVEDVEHYVAVNFVAVVYVKICATACGR